MIKLIFRQGNDIVEQVFRKKEVVIGNQTNDQSDLVLPLPALLPEHLKIFEAGGQFKILNSANDPFVTLNGNSFWKRPLQSGDKVRVRGIEIQFEGALSQGEEEPLTETLEKKIMEKTIDLPLSPQELEEDNLSDDDIEEMVKQLDQWDTGKHTPQPTEEESANLNINTLFEEWKQMESQERHKDGGPLPFPSEEESPSKLYFLFFALVAAIACTGAVLFLFAPLFNIPWEEILAFFERLFRG